MNDYLGTTNIRIKRNDREEEIIRSKPWNLDLMDTARARKWLLRYFNVALKAFPKDTIVIGRIDLERRDAPFNRITGALVGANGRLLRRDGYMDPY